MANIVETVKDLPVRNKVILAAVVAMAIAGILLLFSWTQRADYQVLFSNIAESDAGSIVQKLKELKVPYKLDAGSILVPADKVYDLRLQLAAQGLPHGGGVGFELFDKTDFSTTDFVQKLNYRRALQGELARTILSLTEVEQCRVHLAIPEKSLFVEQGGKPGASVLLRLRPGRTLAQSQVQGIVHLVSSSIEGLNPKDVTVIDSRGEMLTRPVDDMAGLSSSQLEYQKNYEKDIESRVLGILEPVTGKGKVRAKITAKMDFTKSEKTEERYDPDGQVVRSEVKSLEKSGFGGTGGMPGTASNLPGKKGTQTSSPQSQSQKQNETINYEISKITSHVINSSGDIKRLSVAVIIDGTYAAQEGSKEKKYAPRSEEDLKHYEDLVKQAVGFTADRGDEVRVVNMPFETMQQEDLPEASKQYLPTIMSAAKYFIPLVVIALFFLLVVRPLIKTLSVPPASQRLPELALPKTLAEIEKAMASGEISSQSNVVEWAKKNPDQAANLIKGWIEER